MFLRRIPSRACSILRIAVPSTCVLGAARLLSSNPLVFPLRGWLANLNPKLDDYAKGTVKKFLIGIDYEPLRTPPNPHPRHQLVAEIAS
ncbi:hypothetical protein A0H81_13288 [Grifola frondosa]|uniref:Uncharacterized protein n=1 Tax=Grifola frondosa TaxID=5627 RepID=A0A1C7LR69_GRIFR|nr:hypothetical protein A0H81_13288 [Grifola frondosa]